MLDPSRLDPYTPAAIFPDPVPSLPQAVSDFGFVPDINRLIPGDLLFTRPVEPDWVSNNIQQKQRQLYAPSSEWTHVAIYISDWEIIHSRPFRGVHLDTLLNLVPKYIICARRLNVIANATAFDAELMGHKLCLDAALRIGNRYDLTGAAAIYFENARSKWSPKKVLPMPLTFMCSTLYVAAALKLGVYLHSNKPSERNTSVTPQMLHRSQHMQDVPLSWSKVPSY